MILINYYKGNVDLLGNGSANNFRVKIKSKN